MSSGDFRKRFPSKSRRCRHYGDDGRLKRDPCPFRSAECHFVHPDDPEWKMTPIYTNTHVESQRDRESSSKNHGRGRDYSPGRRDGGWGDRDSIRERERDRDRDRERDRERDRGRDNRDRERDRGRDKSRSKERRRTYLSPVRARRESSIASSRSDAAVTTDTHSTPTEAAAIRASKQPLHSPISNMDLRAGKPSPSSSISVGANYSLRPPPPPSVTPPLPPPPPPPTANSVRSPTLLSSKPTAVLEPVTPSTATSGSVFVLPPLPPSTGASASSFTLPPPSSAINTTSGIPPSSAGSTGFLQKEQLRAPILIKSSKPFNSHPASVSQIGAPSASTATAILDRPVATSDLVAAQTGTIVSVTTIDQPSNIDIPPVPATSFDSIPGLSPADEAPTVQMPPTPSGQSQLHLQQQSDSIPQSLPPVPSLPPLPNFEQSEPTVPELSNEAKIELWNKRTKAMAEILILNEKTLRLTSDIDDLKRYSTSPFLTSEPDDKKRIETNIAELEASRESARQAIQKGLDTLTGSDTWPTSPLVEQVQKDNEKMKEYVNELVDVMKQVGETLKELADTAGTSAGKGRRRRKRIKGKEKAGEMQEDGVAEMEKEIKEEKEPLIPSNAMVVDEVSPPTETNNVRKRSRLDDEDDTLIQPGDLDAIRAKFTSLNELWQGISDSIGQTESDWMIGVKEMYQDLVLTQKRSIRSHIEQHKSQVDQHASQLKSDLSQVDTKVETVNKNIDEMVDETTQALETILKLRGERDTLLADHQKFFKEELPGYTARFVAYDAQREKDQKRFAALEATLNAYVNRPPSPVLGKTVSPLGSLETLASTESTSPLPTSISSTTEASASSTTNSSSLNTKIDASDYPLALSNIKPQLINLLRESVKPLVEEIRKQVEEMMNAQKEEMYTNMWSKVEFTWQILAKVQKTAEADIGALLASVDVNGDGRGGNGAAAADVIMKAARDAGSRSAGIPMDTSAGPSTSTTMAPTTHGRGARGDSGGSAAGPNASTGAR